MKKRTMRNIFILLFISGVIAGYLLPGDVRSLAKSAMGNNQKPAMFDVPKRLGQLDAETPNFKYTILAETETGSVELLRFDDKIPMHSNPKENQFVYIYKGAARETIGNAATELSPGQMVLIPSGTFYSLEKMGDTPVEVILFSTPQFAPKDIVWEQK